MASLDESQRQLLRRRRDGELVLDLQSRSWRAVRNLLVSEAEIFDFIEAYYNTTRMHAALDMESPASFDLKQQCGARRKRTIGRKMKSSAYMEAGQRDEGLKGPRAALLLDPNNSQTLRSSLSKASLP